MYTDRLKAIRAMSPLPEDTRNSYNITHLQEPGGYFTFNKQNWVVQDVSKYLDVKWKTFTRRKNEEWLTEITAMSLTTGNIMFIEWYEDDGIEVYVTEQEIKLFDLNIRRSDINDMVEDEAGSIIYKGMTYYYSDDETAAMLYFRGNVGDGVPVRLYEFEAPDGRCLTIEEWYGDVDDERPSREAFISKKVPVKDVAILQIKAA